MRKRDPRRNTYNNVKSKKMNVVTSTITPTLTLLKIPGQFSRTRTMLEDRALKDRGGLTIQEEINPSSQ
jgi:hypothetical protein